MTQKPSRVIVCIGDSITAGGNDESGRNGWPSRVQEGLSRDFNAAVHNLGVPAYITRQVIENTLPQVAGHKPDLLIIAVGVNDARSTTVPPSIPHKAERDPAAYRADVREILQKARALCPNILVVTPMPVDPAKLGQPSPEGLRSRWPAAVVESYVAILKSECAAAGIPVLDLHQGLPDAVAPRSFTAYLVDGLHPNAKGYETMAKLIEAKARPLLG